MLNRLLSAAQLLRPRTLARLAKSDQKLREEVAALSTELRRVTQQLDTVTLREQQLRAVVQSDLESQEQLADFATRASQLPIAAHVNAAIARAKLRTSPFPHCVVDHLLPPEYYDALISSLPPLALFGDRPANKQQLVVPFELASRYSTEVWRHMAQVVADSVIGPAAVEKFNEPLSGWLRRSLPGLGGQPLDGLTFSCSDGRILLRRRGYRIPPHRDPKWGFITCLLYLARPRDDERWGTKLYTVKDDREANGARPHWIQEAQCELVGEVAFRPNRALIFLNSEGAHGAHIPDDAEPADLERYAYQFRVGPTRRSIDAIKARLGPDERELWSGKSGDY